MIEVVLVVLCLLLIASNVFLFLHLKKQQQHIQTIKADNALFEEFFNALPLPLFFQNKNGDNIGNKAFTHAFGHFAKTTFETLSAHPRKSEQYLDLKFDNDIEKSVMVRGIHLFDAAKNALGFGGFIFDMSDINKSKELLLAQKQRLDFAIESSQEGIWDWDIINDNLFYSPKWKSIMGYEVNEKLTNTSAWLNIVHHKDMAMVNEILKLHVDGGNASFDIEHRIRNTEPLKWVNVCGKVIFGKDNKVLRIVGTIRDISARKRDEEDEKKYKDKLATFLDSFPGLVFIKDSQGKYIYMNSFYQKYIDFRAWTHKTPQEIFDFETAEKISNSDRLAMYEGIMEHEIAIPNEEGLSKFFKLYKFPVTVEGNERLLCGFGINKSFSQ